MTQPGVLEDRPYLWAFIAGCMAVTAGVVMHLPMFWMGRSNHFHLADMPMDDSMTWGMALIVGGLVVAAYGLLPRRVAQQAAPDALLQVAAPEDAPLVAAHWRLMVVLTVALVIDVMKPASLGFVLPGMRAEYVVSKATVPDSAAPPSCCRRSCSWGPRSVARCRRSGGTWGCAS
jgi:putative MFS transporter